MLEKCTRTNCLSLRIFTELLLVIGFCAALSWSAPAKSNDESTWHSRFRSAFGTHVEKKMTGGLEPTVPEGNGEIFDKLHDWLQEYLTDKSAEHQMRDLEPAIRSYLNNGANGVLVEVRMFGSGNDFETPFVYIYGIGKDFADAYANGLPTPSIQRDFPENMMSDPDKSSFTWVFEENGRLERVPFPEGWNTESTHAGREGLAARAAGQRQYLAQCKIAEHQSQSDASVPSPLHPSTTPPIAPTRSSMAHLPPHGGVGESEHGGVSGAPAASGHAERVERSTVEHSSTPTEHSSGHGGPSKVEKTWVLETIPLAGRKTGGQMAELFNAPLSVMAAAQSSDDTPIPLPPILIRSISRGPGLITGSLSDFRGTPINCWKIEIHSVRERVVNQAICDKGKFIFDHLPTGPEERYILVVSTPNNEHFERSILLPNSTPKNVQVTLKPKTLNTDIEWGVPGTRAWVDLDGTGNVDFCRILPEGIEARTEGVLTWTSKRATDVLTCNLSQNASLEGLYQGSQRSIPLPTKERTTYFAWVHFHDTQHLDFCRAIPTSTDGRKGRLSCTVWDGTGFGRTISTPEGQPIDLGLPSGRAWVDFNGDGRADFCTLIVSPKLERQLACWLSEGDKFSAVPIVSYDVHWPTNSKLRTWVDVNADGKIDFCSLRGPNNEFFECVLSDGESFMPPIRDLLRGPNE